jgi:hypothetical protein
VLISREEAAHDLGGLHIATVGKFVRTGKLERVYIGRRSMITRASVDALIKSGREQSSPGFARRKAGALANPNAETAP